MREADNLPPYCAVVKKSRSLNFLGPSGPARPVTGVLYLYLLVYMNYHRLQLIYWWKSVEIWLVCMHTVIHVYQSFGFLGSPYALSYLLMQLTCLKDNFGQLRGTCYFHFNPKDGGWDKAILQKKLFQNFQ